MLRAGLLYLSEQPSVFRFVRRNAIARRLASRFVAGETLDEAARAVRELNAGGISASLDLLGESVRTAEEARAAADTAVQMLERIAADRLDANISVKLTQFGLDLDPALCAANARRLLARARALDIFVRVDMESSAYTRQTLDLVERQLFPDFPKHTGVVIQSYLYRSADDVRRLIGLGMRVRLCKGAYKEHETVAWTAMDDIRKSFRENVRVLLAGGNHPAIATHDESLVQDALAVSRESGIAPARFEFQMLYGLRPRRWDELVAAGYNVRIYVPFGTHWMPYFYRRLRERRENVLFVLKGLLGG